MVSYLAEGFSSDSCTGLDGQPRIKEVACDFVVEEVAAYTPSGEGEHLLVWLQKTNMAAEVLMRHISRALDLDTNLIGTAGLKDTRAITRQYISVPAASAGNLDALNSDEVQVLSSGLHGNKLKTGHLKGNRFCIRVPEQSASNVARARVIAEHITRHGFANFYGPQRFGGGDTVRLGLQVLEAGAKGQVPGRKISRMLRRLALSSVQSAVFNQVLSTRLREGLLHTVTLGDVCLVRASGGPFVSDDAARETERLADGEIVTAGPMFGPKMRSAHGEALLFELAALKAAGLKRELFSGFGKLMQGTRRANIVWPENLTLTHQGDGALVFEFTLPPGSYATILLREFWREEATDVG